MADRINTRSYVDIRIRTPEEGSFLQEILIPGLKESAAAAVSVPISAMISYAWHMLAPRSTNTDETIVELARIRLAEEQSRQETERTRIKAQSEQIETLKEIIEGEQANTAKALELLSWADKTTSTAIARADIQREVLGKCRQELEAEANRQELFEDFEEELEEIDEEKMSRLTSRLRPMITEIAQPLKRSADDISFGSANDNKKFAYFDEEIAREIQARTTEEDAVEISGRVKSYDRDTGVGKVVSDDLDRTLNFIVPPSEKRRLRNSILTAMTRNQVTLSCRRTLDESGRATSLLLLDIEITD